MKNPVFGRVTLPLQRRSLISMNKTTYLHNKALLRVYLYYRFVLGALLFTMFFSGAALEVLGNKHPQLFHWTSLSYTLISLATLASFRVERLQTSVNRIFAFLIIDLVVILLLVHASGGLESGLGYLFLVSVAMASIFVRGQLCLAFAALTSILIIGETVYLAQSQSNDGRTIFSAGVLGILTFATALAFQYLTSKIRASDIEAASQAQYADHLQRLAQLIVARMRTGIIVVDPENKVELINQSAVQLLGLTPDEDYLHRPLESFSSLADILEHWHGSAERGSARHYIAPAGHEIRVNFTTLDTGSDARTLLFLEDHRLLAQQAQQLKLASLGRLTASIAHEVRNPLGAISHAAQLLSESPHIHASDQRLTEIVHRHSQRVNQIIENTLVLSRRRNPNPELINLGTWLSRFVNEYNAGKDARIKLQIDAQEVMVKVDPTQLNQILTNLCDNGLRYSKLQTGEASITIAAGTRENSDTPFIAVVDEGPGVPDDKLQQVFDPFFTTDDQGSGLGLYISKELCEINQASLRFRRTEEGKSCFRIDFSHHQRLF
jgi:two-component system sensor histidine kinase PilS (NtrC family)